MTKDKPVKTAGTFGFAPLKTAGGWRIPSQDCGRGAALSWRTGLTTWPDGLT